MIIKTRPSQRFTSTQGSVPPQGGVCGSCSMGSICREGLQVWHSIRHWMHPCCVHELHFIVLIATTSDAENSQHIVQSSCISWRLLELSATVDVHWKYQEFFPQHRQRCSQTMTTVTFSWVELNSTRWSFPRFCYLHTIYDMWWGRNGIMVIRVFMLCPWLTGQLHKVILIDVSRRQAQSTCEGDTNELINFIYEYTDWNKDWLTHPFMSSESEGSFACLEWWVLTKAPFFHSTLNYLSEFCCYTKCCLSMESAFLPPMYRHI